MQQTISVVIPIFNVAPIIGRCLDALTWANEVVLVDMFSTDGTEEICRRYPNVRFLQNRDYIYANVNFGFEHASSDWVMRLDSDEVVSSELANEIQSDVLGRADNPYSGYWVPSRNFFFGKWIKHGIAGSDDFAKPKPGYSYRKLIFKKGSARYACVSEHEDITYTGELGILDGHYDHFSHRSVTQWIGKMNYYTDRDIERIDVASVDFRAPKPWKTVAAVTKIFYDLYIKRKGHKDGLYGFMVCALNAIYLLVYRCKVWEKWYRHTHPSEITEY